MLCEAWQDLTGEDIGGDTSKPEALIARLCPPFARVPEPVSPCIVLLLTPGRAPHAGLFRNGRVLHIREDGARYEPLRDAVRGFDEVRYYASGHADQGPPSPA